MSLIEKSIQIRSKEIILYPITYLTNIKDDAESLTDLKDDDGVPLIDASNSGKMGKTTWANIKTVLSGLFAEKTHVHSAATTAAAGFMSAADKIKLNSITSGANKYVHPTYTEKSSGIYKITIDATGHVSATAAVTKADITALGIPSVNTTYTNMTGATTTAAGKAGLVPAPTAGAATRYLRSDGTWQVPPNTTYTLNSFGITATAKELNYIGGVTSNIQTQLNNKLPLSGGTLTGELIPNAGMKHSGTTYYVSFPDGGQYSSTASSVTGYCKIILPVSWTATMLKFKVSIFDYASNESVDYIVAGYNYTAGANWTNCTAYCLGKPGAVHSNLPVVFGHDGTHCVIAIGSSTTKWAYPQVAISDVLMGYSNNAYATWRQGWSVVFNATAISNVDVTISNTNVAYGATPASHNHSAANINSGTLTIARGGTGATTAAAALSNLGLTATAAEINKLDGMTATKAELNYLVGVTSSIQTQLNTKAAKAKVVTVTLSASQWTKSSSGYTQKETVSGVSSTETTQVINIIPKVSSQAAYMEAGVYASAQTTNAITFVAAKKPSVNLTVYAVIETV